LLEVARHWGLLVKAIGPATCNGYYRYDTEIGIGVDSFSTWSHELVHAADDRLHNLSRGRGQALDNEVVATFGSAILLQCLGYTVESDPGGAYAYIERYCRK